MAVNAGTAYIDILPNMAQFAAAVGSGMRRVGPQMAAAGAKLTRGLTIPLIAAGTAVTKLSLNFSDAMTNIRALVGASDKQMRQYREGVLALAGKTTKGPTELAESLYFLASAGFEGKTALNVLEAAAKASSAGLGDTQQVAQTVGAAVNAYGEKALSAASATDVLVATVREGTAEPAELAGALGRVIAPAQAVGVEFQEVGGAVAGLTLTGLDAAESVTALRGILTSFLGPGTQAKETLKDFGLTAKEVQEDIRSKGLLDTLQDLRDRFGDNNDAMRKLFPNVRAFNGFLALTGRNAEKNAKAMDAVVHSTGDADKAFNKASESVGFKFRSAIADLQVSLLKFGDILLPIVAEAAEKVAGLADAFGDLSPTAQKMIVWGGIIAAALGPVLWLLGNVTTAVGGLVSAFITLEKTKSGASVWKAGWASALATNPWFLAAAAIAAVGVAIVVMGEHASESEEAVRDLTDATREYISASAELNESARTLEQSRIDEKRSAAAVVQARRTLIKVSNDEHASIREIKEARLNVRQAELDHANALARLTEAQNKNRESQRKLVAERAEAKQNIKDMNGALMEELGILRATRGPSKVTAENLRKMVQGADANKLYEFVDGLIANSVAFGRTRKEAGKAREDIFDYIKTTGTIPDEKELRLLVDDANGKDRIDDFKAQLNSIPAYKAVTITVSQRGSTAAIGTNAEGTSNWRGGLTWVGEEGPELLNVPRGSRILSNEESTALVKGRTGRQRLVITNWDEGTGYIEDISDDSVADAGRLSQQTRRMRR